MDVPLRSGSQDLPTGLNEKRDRGCCLSCLGTFWAVLNYDVIGIHLAGRRMLILAQLWWCVVLTIRWIFPLGESFFTNWAFMFQTVFHWIRLFGFFQRHLNEIARWTFYIAWTLSWVIFLGVTVVLGFQANGLTHPTLEQGALQHHYVHIAPLLANLVMAGHIVREGPAPPLVFRLVVPFILPVIYDLNFDPSHVYGIHQFSFWMWLLVVVVSVLLAQVILVIVCPSTTFNPEKKNDDLHAREMQNSSTSEQV